MDFELSAADAAFRDEIRGWLEERRDLIDKTRKETAEYGGQIGRARVGKECRSRWSPYH